MYTKYLVCSVSIVSVASVDLSPSVASVPAVVRTTVVVVVFVSPVVSSVVTPGATIAVVVVAACGPSIPVFRTGPPVTVRLAGLRLKGGQLRLPPLREHVLEGVCLVGHIVHLVARYLATEVITEADYVVV